jgi:ABC-type antimicrobial peptide transport system permease subunit
VTQTELASISKPLAGKANTIHIKLAPGADTAAVIDAVKNAAPDLRVMTWENYAGVVRSMTDSFHIIDVILNVVNLLVAGITIFIVTYIDVASRRRQIGIQRALGITPASVTMSYIMRALFYSLLALGAAALLFIYVIIPVEGRYPFHFPFGNVYLRVVPSFFLRMAAAVLGVSIVAAFIPVQQVIKVKIIDAIWG